MEKIKAVIIDDEKLARENLKMLIHDFCPEIELIGMADGKHTGIHLIREKNPDLVFLDIRMPSGSEGFEVLEATKNINYMVVFVTAFKDFALKAFKANALQYLMKPVDIDELMEVQNKVRQMLPALNNPSEVKEIQNSYEALEENIQEQGISRITIHHTKGFKVVYTKDIVRLEASGNCTEIHFKDGTKYLDTRTLKVYDEMLEENAFYRIHKSHLINLKFLQEYQNQDGYKVILTNGTALPVARNRLKDFLASTRVLD